MRHADLTNKTMERHDWTRLSSLQLGRYAEYYAKMEFSLYGFDVYSNEVDDKGIDFVIRKDAKYYDIQVKSVRRNNYVFFPKDKFVIRENLFATVLLFAKGQLPDLYLLPSIEWTKCNALFVSRDYEGLKSKPEWGLNISGRNRDILSKYEFGKIAEKM